MVVRRRRRRWWENKMEGTAQKFSPLDITSCGELEVKWMKKDVDDEGILVDGWLADEPINPLSFDGHFHETMDRIILANPFKNN